MLEDAELKFHPVALTADPVNIGSDETVLATISDDAVHLALWDRPRPATLHRLDDLTWDEIDDIDRDIDVADLGPAIAEALTSAGYPTGAVTRSLWEDVHRLAEMFAQIFNCNGLRVRLEIVETDACSKFHADMVTARLLTTLSGPATQWIYADHPDRVHDMRTGAVGVFKGRIAVEKPDILHRSPPIDSSGIARLLLAINPS